MEKKLTKNKVGRPKKFKLGEKILPFPNFELMIKYEHLSIPLKIVFVFSWSMIAVLVVLTIMSFM